MRSAGLLLPLSALPSAFGVGDLGREAFRFVDALAAAKLSWWQMLPIGPLGAGHSPYDSCSAFAGDPLYISLELLAQDGWLKRSELHPTYSFRLGQAEYDKARQFREPLLRLAYARFNHAHRRSAERDFVSFCRRAHFWLEDVSLYLALNERFHCLSWVNWDPDLRRRQKGAIRRAQTECQAEISYQRFLQWQFDKQWTSLRRYAVGRGVRLIGDIAIYVSHQSADVWAHQRFFRLDRHGRSTVVAGVPPDYFSQDGQRWGNPVYRWDRLAQNGYEWWIERFKQALQRFDAIRLDHFIGFYRGWEIPVHAQTAQQGRYRPGPGAHFFHTVKRRLGSLPFIAEDLGVVAPGVKTLRDLFQFPGMKVLQFAFGNDPEAKNYQPHRYEKHSVAYTGTHDNDTLSGWWADQGSSTSTRTPIEIKREKACARRYLGGSARNIPWRLIRLLWASTADTTIIPVQDLLGLGSHARMNRPGTSTGNWVWRLRPHQLKMSLLQRLNKISSIYERLSFSEPMTTWKKTPIL